MKQAKGGAGVKKWGLVVAVVVLLIVTGVIMAVSRPAELITEPFELPSSLFAEAGVVELTAEEYEEKIAAGESFLVLAHAVACPVGMPLTDLTRALAAEKQMTIYSLKQEKFSNSSLKAQIKYLPSMAVVKEGKVVAYLDAESNRDLPAYQSVEGLTNWLSQYVKL